MSTSSSFDVVQSAYRRLHSTETALLKITDDIFAGFDDHQSTILVALDQSAAFDCVDHKTLISRLDNTYGVTGSALDWIRSYLDARSTFVRWKQNSSDVFLLILACLRGYLLDRFFSRFTSHRFQPSSTRSVLLITSTLTTRKSTSQCRGLTYLTKLVCYRTARLVFTPGYR